MLYLFEINSQYMPYPREREPFTMEYIPFGASRRMANGNYRVQYTTGRWRVIVHWEGLTQAERNTLWTQYGGSIATPVTVVLPNGETYTMMSGLGSWNENQWYSIGDAAWYYDISFALEQV